MSELKLDGLCIADDGRNGWIIQGFAQGPLTENQCEEIVRLVKSAEQLATVLNEVKYEVLSANMCERHELVEKCWAVENMCREALAELDKNGKLEGDSDGKEN